MNKEIALDQLRWAGKTRLNAGKKKGGVREKPWSSQRQMLGTLASKPLSCGDTQINRNGLN